ncbi:MAG: hypothetical protein ACE5OP_13040, partial [Candidatus Glassbacteria bacterium]
MSFPERFQSNETFIQLGPDLLIIGSGDIGLNGSGHNAVGSISMSFPRTFPFLLDQDGYPNALTTRSRTRSPVIVFAKTGTQPLSDSHHEHCPDLKKASPNALTIHLRALSGRVRNYGNILSL